MYYHLGVKTLQRYFTTATAFLATIVLLAGCDNLTSVGTGDGGARSDGTMKVLLTDAPFPYDLVDAANVTITSVEARSQSEGRIVLSEEAQSFDLLELRDGVTDLLAEQTLPADTYEQIRLVVSDTASVTLKDGRTFDLKVPSGTQTGLKVNLDGLTVDEGKSVELTLDFDLAKSFAVRGHVNSSAGIKGFIFKPVVHFKGQAEDHDDDGLTEMEGKVEAVGTNHLVVGGRRFEVTSATQLEGFDALSDLMLGTRIEVAFTQEGEDTYRAVSIEVEDGDDDEGARQEVTGPIEAVNAAYIEMGGDRYYVNAATTYEGSFADLAGLAVGTKVEVTFVEREDGTFLAKSIEQKDIEQKDIEQEANDEG